MIGGSRPGLRICRWPRYRSGPPPSTSRSPNLPPDVIRSCSAKQRQWSDGELWENLAQPVASAVTLQYRSKHVAVIGRHGQIARTFEDLPAQARPWSQNTTAFY